MLGMNGKKEKNALWKRQMAVISGSDKDNN